jgi:DNA-binding NarL/FixJ family response regulator
MEPLRVLIVDDHPLFREGVAHILSAQPDIEVVAEAADGRQAVDLARETKPDLVLMDVRMPVLDGIAATHELLDGGGDAPRVIMLTTFDLDEHVFAAFRAGASGFLLKDLLPSELSAAVRSAVRGDALLAPALTRRLIEERIARDPAPEPADLSGLTDREVEVLRLVARGLSNNEIAEQLYLSYATVKTHVARILAKTGARDRVQAVVVAYESGLVQVGRDAS